MSKVYVVYADYDYEGYSEPEAVFSSLALAEAERDRISSIISSRREILEIEVDAPSRW